MGRGKDLSRCSTCSRKAGWQVRSKAAMCLSAVLSTYCLAVVIACGRRAGELLRMAEPLHQPMHSWAVPAQRCRGKGGRLPAA